MISWITQMLENVLLTRYEVARIVGLRSLQLSEGAFSEITIQHKTLGLDMLYIAAMELKLKKLDIVVQRPGGVKVHVKNASIPACLDILINTKDNGNSCML